MNVLAQLLQAGDFLSPLEFDRLDPRVQAGIRRHRRVGELTDEHPVVARRRRRRVPAPRPGR